MSVPTKIETLLDLVTLVHLKKSVTVPGWGGFQRPKAAAFILNMSGAIIHRMMVSGMFVYEPKESKKQGWQFKSKDA